MSKIENLVYQLLSELGENPDREGLVNTPSRVARSLGFLTSGYHLKPADVINGALFSVECNDMVIVRDIEVYSMCEHHMLPFFGKCHIGYIPNGKVFGVSKLARLVDVFARRLQLQERLTRQVARVIRDSVDAEGVGVVMECKHLCMMMRGVEKQNSKMITSAMLGSFHKSDATRNEFLELINSGRD